MKKVYVDIDNVLRNFVRKFEFVYEHHFLETENDEENFEYKISDSIFNDDLKKYFTFQSNEQYLNFRYIDFVLELYGHSNPTYSNVFNELNSLIYNKKFDVTLIGIDEFGKAKSATLFFLSKNGCLADNIKFIKTDDIEKHWKKCKYWVTDNINVIEKKPSNKKVIRFNNDYTNHINLVDYEIEKIKEIENLKFK